MFDTIESMGPISDTIPAVPVPQDDAERSPPPEVSHHSQDHDGDGNSSSSKHHRDSDNSLESDNDDAPRVAGESGSGNSEENDDSASIGARVGEIIQFVREELDDLENLKGQLCRTAEPDSNILAQLKHVAKNLEEKSKNLLNQCETSLENRDAGPSVDENRETQGDTVISRDPYHRRNIQLTDNQKLFW